MAILLSVTDAISEQSNHGITRTERKLAAALAGRDGVKFVAMRKGRLWQADPADVVARAQSVDPDRPPVVERLGIDPPPVGSGVRTVRARLATRRDRPAKSVGLAPLSADAGDTLVSVGLDWVHGLVDEAQRLVLADGVRYFGFCYDMIPADHPEWLFPPDPWGFLSHFEQVTRIADRVLCISESTRRDFLRHFPEFPAERATVVALGADAAVSRRPAHDLFAADLFGGEPYAVYCATLDRRKNHHVLYRAVRELVRRGVPGNVALIGMVGNGVADLLDCLRHDPAVAGRFVHVTDCDDSHLAAVYRHARFAVYPSLYEGWGLGVTEALAHGTPCLIASGSSLEEAGLGVCRVLHPLRTADWADAMEEMLAAPIAVPPLALPTWQGAADALLALAGTAS